MVEKLGIGNWAIDRGINPLSNPYLAPSHYTGTLAQHWELVNGTTFRFTIRDGIAWHDKEPMNGRPLTAEDVVFNFQRLSGTGPFDEPPLTAGRFRQLAFKALDARGNQVHIELAEPRADALPIFLDDGFAFILPPEVITAHGDVADWRTLVGTGPFLLHDWVAGESLSYRHNPAYWGTDEKYPEHRLPYVDELRIVIMPEPASWLAALRAGRVDYIGANVATAVERFGEAARLLSANPELRTHRYYARSDQAFAMYVPEQRGSMDQALVSVTIPRAAHVHDSAKCLPVRRSRRETYSSRAAIPVSVIGGRSGNSATRFSFPPIASTYPLSVDISRSLRCSMRDTFSWLIPSLSATRACVWFLALRRSRSVISSAISASAASSILFRRSSGRDFISSLSVVTCIVVNLFLKTNRFIDVDS